jgi:glutathione S-transferase
MRFKTYGLGQHPSTQAYLKTITQAPGVAAWIADALAEKEFLDFEEPYRFSR